MRVRPAAIIPLLALFAAGPAYAQVVRGRVIDHASGEGVAEARVEAFAGGNSGGRARSSADGKFEMRLRAPGTFRLHTGRSGFNESVTGDIPVEARETVYVEVRMASSPMQLEPLRVTARVAPPRRRSLEMNGFYDRERMGFGRFIRREDFENRSNLQTSQVLSRERGTIVVGSGASELIVFARSSGTGALRWRGARARYCIPDLYLDGMRITDSATLNDVVRPSQIEAVELYRNTSEIPAQYAAGNAHCGVILIWTRHEP
jgi:hypothetical protein